MGWERNPKGVVTENQVKPWMRYTLLLAGIYNLVWGALVVLFPLKWFELAGMEAPRYPELWQCIGMIVGVYGVGYLAAATNPLVHWPIVLVGLLGKVLGPIGFFEAAFSGRIPWTAGLTIITNDIVWWLPFASILCAAHEAHLGMKRISAPEIRRMALRSQTQHGVSLERLSKESPVLLVFLRHTGCTFCREALADIAAQRATIEANGTRIVLVHMGTEENARKICERYGLGDLHRVSDPKCVVYKAFGLGRGGLWALFGPRVWWRGFVAGVLKGHRVGALAGDGFQMPGVFLIFHGEIVRSYIHQSAADRPNYIELAAPEGMAPVRVMPERRPMTSQQ